MSYAKSTIKTPIGKNSLRGDKELILDVNKMFGHLNRYIPEKRKGANMVSWNTSLKRKKI